LARKILLADDSVTAQNMGRRILSDAGYDVTTVNNGSAALKKIAESKPDLIVLDVYMPGYGGLEVCQRLREAPETARIPVLLTVGKLEPFKADEARRVRADGFIVKPFEASELLTALTKLEDKIVPQSQPAKPSRFAKALAAADDQNPGKEFGDSETGWKNRLSIPPPHGKHHVSAPEESPAAVASSHQATATEADKPIEMKSGLEEALLSSMPQDVTAEEIAAIKAAAAAFSAPGDTSTPHNRRASDRVPTHGSDARAEETPTESVASAEKSAGTATFASVSEPQAEVAETISAAQAESPAPAEQTVPSNEVPAEASPAMMISDLSSSTAPQETTAEAGKLVDEEVNAALASLAPTNGHGAAIDTATAGSSFVTSDQMTMAANAAAQQFNGPRWIAEPVAVMDDEATLALEQEMERARAAFAAADAARMSFASTPAEQYASRVAEQLPAVSSETPASAVESFSTSEGAESNRLESDAQTMAEPEMPVPADPATADAVSDRPVAMEESAYAAAASASPSAEPIMAVEANAQPISRAESPENSDAPDSGGRQGESELAAAWANWRQIRESVVGSQLSQQQLSSQIADTVAEVKDGSGEAHSESLTESKSASATGEEATEIANLVDSVLADLKPKLMAEIAKKMGKEKKK
jgi:CheY-like chemotaxis protein